MASSVRVDTWHGRHSDVATLLLARSVCVAILADARTHETYWLLAINASANSVFVTVLQLHGYLSIIKRSLMVL